MSLLNVVKLINNHISWTRFGIPLLHQASPYINICTSSNQNYNAYFYGVNNVVALNAVFCYRFLSSHALGFVQAY